jgi:L-lactate dehydrogenase complex protein LldG
MRADWDGRPASPSQHAVAGFDGELVSRFTDKLREAAGTITRTATIDDVPDAVMGYLATQGLPRRLEVAPALASLPWSSQLEMNISVTGDGDEVSVTPCFAAVADTGSLVLLSGSDSQTTSSFLPNEKIIVVRRDQIVSHIEDVWPRLREHPEGMPRTVDFIAGPARSAAAVGQTLRFDTHGPRRLHVVLVES